MGRPDGSRPVVGATRVLRRISLTERPLPLLAEDRCRLHMLDLMLPLSAGCWERMRDAGEGSAPHRRGMGTPAVPGAVGEPQRIQNQRKWQRHMKIPAGLSRVLFAWVWGRGLAPAPTGRSGNQWFCVSGSVIPDMVNNIPFALFTLSFRWPDFRFELLSKS